MKVYPFKIPKPLHDSLVYQVDYDVAFYDKLHQHDDIQFSFIVEGEGRLVVGDSINQYKKDDIVVIGSNLPHVFKSNVNASERSHMLTLFFSKDSFGTDFFELEELRELNTFFKRASHGFKITSSKKPIILLFNQLENATKLSRFLILLDLLKKASVCNYISLSSFIYEKKYKETEGKRMQEVFDYTMTHFESDISLETISDVANMSKNAFCKYFKKRTNKTYFRFLNELRIEHGCKLLIDKNDASIAEVAYECGFRNISNFNRQFKMIKNMSPNNFRNKKH
ncbi:AraC family transcriptional regulator [Yeosuana sp.]|uniref:AraC family transcriptional regulator n=1 Tax=Yeosuana sp. TaxID=2529388 RepID=UPI004054EF45|tara:strand:- start:1338 stop:2183 length:846 start_codon:yes stop_codon:yes gene_type:complete